MKKYMRISKRSYRKNIASNVYTYTQNNRHQLFYFAVSAAQNGEFERFEGLCVTVCGIIEIQEGLVDKSATWPDNSIK